MGLLTSLFERFSGQNHSAEILESTYDLGPAFDGFKEEALEYVQYLEENMNSISGLIKQVNAIKDEKVKIDFIRQNNSENRTKDFTEHYTVFCSTHNNFKKLEKKYEHVSSDVAKEYRRLIAIYKMIHAPLAVFFENHNYEEIEKLGKLFAWMKKELASIRYPLEE